MRHFISLLVFGLALTACVHRSPELKFGPEGQLERVEDVLAHVENVERSVVSLKASGKLNVDSPQGRGTLSLWIAVGTGGKLHLETMDFFGKPLGFVVSDGKRFGVYQAQPNHFYTGPATPAAVSQFLPIGLPPQEMEDLLLGRVPRWRYANLGPLVLDKEEGAYRVELQRGGGTQTLWVDTETFRVKKTQVKGAPGYDLAFSEPLTQDGKTLPRVTTLHAESVQTSLTLRYEELNIDAPLEEALFDAKAPAGATLKQLNEDGAEIIPRPKS